jgi:hypothetical protein
MKFCGALPVALAVLTAARSALADASIAAQSHVHAARDMAVRWRRDGTAAIEPRLAARVTVLWREAREEVEMGHLQHRFTPAAFAQWAEHRQAKPPRRRAAIECVRDCCSFDDPIEAGDECPGPLWLVATCFDHAGRVATLRFAGCP